MCAIVLLSVQRALLCLSVVSKACVCWVPIWQSGWVAPEPAPLPVAMATASAPLGIPSCGCLPGLPTLALGAISERPFKVRGSDTRQGSTLASSLAALLTSLTA